MSNDIESLADKVFRAVKAYVDKRTAAPAVSSLRLIDQRMQELAARVDCAETSIDAHRRHLQNLEGKLNKMKADT